jgi:HEAT repeat protein
MVRVIRSLQFFANEGSKAPNRATRAAAAIFQKTNDEDARRLCLEALSRINTKTARAELLKIYEREPQSDLRSDIAIRLRQAVTSDARVKPAEAKALLNQLNQQ